LNWRAGGADIAGVVSFHGGLDSPKPEDGRNIKCKVLAMQGADDPFVTPKDMAAFEDEMRKNRVDWETRQIWRRGAQFHPVGRRERQFQGRGLQRGGGQAVLGGHEAVFSRRYSTEDRHRELEIFQQG